MNNNEITKIILDLLKQIAPDTEPSALQPDDDIRHSLGIDSFDFLRFIIGLEKKLGVNTPESDYGKVTTLRNLLDYLTARVK